MYKIKLTQTQILCIYGAQNIWDPNIKKQQLYIDDVTIVD